MDSTDVITAPDGCTKYRQSAVMADAAPKLAPVAQPRQSSSVVGTAAFENWCLTGGRPAIDPQRDLGATRNLPSRFRTAA